MGIRFRKSINLGGGARINLSKSGIGYSVGTKGARVTKTARGTTRKTVSIPNTGISYSTETGKKKKRSSNSTVNNTVNQNTTRSLGELKVFAFLFRFLGILLILFGLIATFAFPVYGIAAVIGGVIIFAIGRMYKKQLKEAKKARQQAQPFEK